jgi:four helix bundle protein
MAKEWDLKKRTMQFALEAARFCRAIPNTTEGRHVRSQLFRSATGTAANYRAVCRSKTDRDLIAKFGTVIEEADETAFWLEFCTRAGLTNAGDEQSLLREANELVAIFMQGRRTTRRNVV